MPDELLALAACTGEHQELGSERRGMVGAVERSQPAAAGRHGGRRRAFGGRGRAACRHGSPARGQPGGPAPAHARAAPHGLLVHGVRRPAARSAAGQVPAVADALALERAGRAGAATWPVHRRPACGRCCAPAATSRATARPRARRRPGARVTGARASACSKRAPDGRCRPAASCRKVSPAPPFACRPCIMSS